MSSTSAIQRHEHRTAVVAPYNHRQVNKKDFPTNKVYGAIGRPELRLITCGGRPLVDGHRADNIILYADLAQ